MTCKFTLLPVLFLLVSTLGIAQNPCNITHLVSTPVSCNVIDNGQSQDGEIEMLTTAQTVAVEYSFILQPTVQDDASILILNGSGSAVFGPIIHPAGSAIDDTVRGIINLPISQSYLILRSNTRVEHVRYDNNNLLLASSSTAGSSPLSYSIPSANFSWNTGQSGTVVPDSTYVLSSLNPGNYILTVSHQNGCSQVYPILVEQPAPLNVDLNITGPQCPTGSTGFGQADALGGTAPYNYYWSTSPPQSGPVVEDIQTNTITVTIDDSLGCNQTFPVVVPSPQPLTFDTVVTHVTCAGANDGRIEINVNDLVLTIPGFSFLDSSRGSYYYYSDSVAIWTEAYDRCIEVGGELVSINDSVENSFVHSLASSLNKDILTGMNDTGLEGVFAHPDGIPISYTNWATGEPNNNNNLEDCTEIRKTNGQWNDIRCNKIKDYILEMNVDFQWSHGANTGVVENLSPGNYTVTITSVLGCNLYMNFTVTEPDPLSSISISNNESTVGAMDGTAGVFVSGGTQPYSYEWSTAQTTNTITGLGEAAYDVTITDSKACIDSNTVIVQTDTSMSVRVTSVTPVTCFGDSTGEIVIKAVNGIPPFIYSWASGDSTDTLRSLIGGVYSVTVTDSVGTSASTSVLVEVPFPLSIQPEVIDISCYDEDDGEIDVNPNGGTAPYEYLWCDSSTTPSRVGLSEGYFHVTVTDDRNCIFVDSFEVFEPDSLLNTALVDHVQCNGDNNGGIEILTTGGTAPFDYSWSNSTTNPNLANLGAGWYALTLTDDRSCQVVDSFEIVEAPPIQISDTIQQVSCFGSFDGEIDIEVVGGAAPIVYSWSTGDTTQDLDSLSGGSYLVDIVDNNGCANFKIISILQPQQLSVNVLQYSDVSCYDGIDGSIEVGSLGGGTHHMFTWSTGDTTSILDSLGADNYTVAVIDNNGCTDSMVITISEPDSLALIAQSSPISCFGVHDGSIGIQASGGSGVYNYNWSHGSVLPFIQSLPEGAYTVTVTDDNGCTATYSDTLTEPPFLQVAVNTTPPLCSGESNGSVEVDVLGGIPPFKFNWSNGTTDSMLTNVEAGVYLVNIIDDNGCQTNAITELKDPPAINYLSLATPVSCSNQSDGQITLNVTGGVGVEQIEIRNEIGMVVSESLISSSLPAGTYEILIIDSNGCQIGGFEDVGSVIDMVVTADSINPSCFDPTSGSISLIVDGGNSPFTYDWQDGSNQPSRENLSQGTYIAMVTDRNGCLDSVRVDLSLPDDCIQIPTGFTPNGDGVNDTWEIQGITGYADVQVVILDRYGNVVVEWNDASYSWDGKADGNELVNGTCMYWINLNDGNPAITGTVTILK